ncbi:MAG: prepilin-type N-terminal cleavage/methylation domain-containing protein [Gemmatimonadaceae bacterium]|nr:prepilin-type N-terminal cleavage/methylation domain-containing protein [Gemmatimonadaceae bacterium]
MQNRKGFTLIELLIVVVIIGILAAIAIPKFANTKEKAYLAAMKSDLRNLATAQENHAAEYPTVGYATAIGATQVSGTAASTPSAGVTVAPITANAGMGWTATATHTSTAKTCAIAVGSETNPLLGTAAEGEPVCQ